MSTETQTTSWGSRLGNSFKGILTGFIFVVVAVGLLFWNEGRTIKRAKALKEVAESAISVDPQKIDSANEDKPVHFSGDVVTQDVVSDPEFGISLNALKLERKVEMYQWEESSETETRRTSGGGQESVTTYSYQKVWSERLIDSSSFHEAGHDNPSTTPYASTEFIAQNATLGAFSLTKDQIESLEPSVEYDVNQASSEEKVSPSPTGVTTEPNSAPTPTQATPEKSETPSTTPSAEQETGASAYHAAFVTERFAQDFSVSTEANTDDLIISSSDTNVQIPSSDVNLLSQPTDATSKPELKISGNGYYIGDPSNAKIGDVKITFSYVETPCPTSFVGQQHGDLLIPYETKTGKVLLQSSGIHSLQEMIGTAQKENKLIAWILRILGLVFIYAGIKTILSPLVVMADLIPFIAKIVDFGTGVVAFCGTLFLGLGAISVGWIYYRPLVGIPMLVIAIGALFYPFLRGKKQNAQNSSADQNG